MTYKLQRFGIIFALLSVLAIVVGVIYDQGFVVVGGLSGCAISFGLLIDDSFFRENNND